ncbi:MAG: virulence RhuM family protein [Ignavibacteria bacterium]|nr:virulence RhuM family protein [Ignavibacteria bacterium]
MLQSEHTKHNFNHGELELKQTVRKFRTVRTEGKKQVSRELDYYNLDLNISVGYRVNYFIGALNSVLSTVVFNGIQFLPRISS